MMNTTTEWLQSPKNYITKTGNTGLLCTLVRDEPDYLIWKWVKHHESVGFDVIIYNHISPDWKYVNKQITNTPEWGLVREMPGQCCADNTERCQLCQKCALYEPGVNNEVHGFSVCQLAAYSDCLYNYANKYIWVGNWDIDEYVFVEYNSSYKNLRSKPLFESIKNFESIQVQCLKFGPRRLIKSLYAGDPDSHLWRAPYKHLGENISCATKNEIYCEAVGAHKVLSRVNKLLRMNVHEHILKNGELSTKWNVLEETTNVRCHHYFIRSKDHLKEKAHKNKNVHYNSQLISNLLDNSGFFNSIFDTTFQSMKLSDVCISILTNVNSNVQDLENLYSKILQLIRKQHIIKFQIVIIDNRSSMRTRNWIYSKHPKKVAFLRGNQSTGNILDQALIMCKNSRFLMNVVDKIGNDNFTSFKFMLASIKIMDTHKHIVKTFLTPRNLFQNSKLGSEFFSTQQSFNHVSRLNNSFSKMNSKKWKVVNFYSEDKYDFFVM